MLVLGLLPSGVRVHVLRLGLELDLLCGFFSDQSSISFQSFLSFLLLLMYFMWYRVKHIDFI